MHRDGSNFKDHPRITWFGTGGTVAYVDYISATESCFIGASERGGFKVIPPNTLAESDERHGFATIDAAIEWALEQAR